MSFAFWSANLNPNSAYKFTPESGNVLHLSAAVLGKSASKGRTLIVCQYGGQKSTICSLRQGGCENFGLDLVFPSGKEITFKCHGDSQVCLSGYLQPLEEMESAEILEQPIQMNGSDVFQISEDEEVQQASSSKRKREEPTEIADSTEEPEKKKKKKDKKKSKHKKSKTKRMEEESADECEMDENEESVSNHSDHIPANYMDLKGINGYKLKHFCLLSKPSKVACDTPTKSVKSCQMDRILKSMNDEQLFGTKWFQSMRIYQHSEMFEEEEGPEYPTWTAARDTFMNDMSQMMAESGLWNEFVQILKLLATVWNHKHRQRPLEFRWPIKEDIEDRLMEQMDEISDTKVMELLNEIFDAEDSDDTDALYDLFYDKYLSANSEQILKGSGFGRCLFLYRILTELEAPQNDEKEDPNALKEALKTANNDKEPNIVHMIQNLDSKKIENHMLSVNAILQNKQIRMNINEALVKDDYDSQSKYLSILENIEQAIHRDDAYRPKDNDNENVYMLCYQTIDGEEIKVFPRLEDSDEVKEWIQTKENAECLYACYGYINYGYCELGTLDDIKSYFIEKLIETNKFCILKLNLNGFKNWNSWTNLNWDHNSNSGDNVDKIHRSVLGVACIVPIEVTEIKVNKKRVSMYECEVATQNEIFRRAFRL
eukprot:121447_1